MNRILVSTALAGFLLISSGSSVHLDSRYSSQLNAILEFISRCSPASYRVIQENVRAIEVQDFGERMNTGDASYDPAGVIRISNIYFDDPYRFIQDGRWAQDIAALIVHEARHEWQFSHWWGIFLNSRDPIVKKFLENDANEFAVRLHSDCDSLQGPPP